MGKGSKNRAKNNYEPMQEKDNRKALSNCNPTICNKKFLLSDDGDIINELDVSDRCKCINKETCRSILFALRTKDMPKALELFENLSVKD